jgi:hypothetical protein
VTEEIEWFVGIDWASQSHQVCLVDARGECLGERAVAHGGPAEPAQSVLDRASTVLPLPWRALRHKVSRGVIAPLFSLDHWWEGRCQINLRRATGTRSRMRVHTAATAFRHSLAASARKIRSVDRETRWR